MAVYYLSHHGVKGMKWGVRKQRQSTRVAPSSTTAQQKPPVRQPVRRSAPKRQAAPAQRRDPYDYGYQTSYQTGRSQGQSWLRAHRTQLLIGGAAAAAGALIARQYLKKHGVNNFSTFKSYANSLTRRS